MPRYEQLKAKSKGISYTRQIRNESKEINLKKPLIISVLFIIIAAIIFTAFKKYSPMVDIAIKDFFSINHREALALESDGMSEDTDKMSFLNNIPLFNFFIKANTNETLSVMTYETNSKIEAALDTLTNDYNFTNSNIITRESLLPFFNNSGVSNSIFYDSGYVDYGNNHDSVLFREDNHNNTEEYTNNENNIIVSNNNNNTSDTDKNHNYLEQMILESRNNNNPSSKRNNMMSNNNSAAVNNSSYADNYHTENKKTETNTNTPKSIFDDILKPKENVKRETTTMKPASSTTFSSRPPQSYNNTNQYKSSDVYLKNNNIEANKNIEQNNDTVNNHRTSLNNTLKREENNSYDMNAQDRKDIIRSSIYTMTNSLDKPNIDYNRVINDMVNPNNNNIIKREENIKKDNVIKDENIIKEAISKENNSQNSIKEEIIRKAKNDINNYNIKKANNTVERASLERDLKQNSDEGIYLVEYSERTGAITLIFRSRKFSNRSSIKDAINELLIGATDEENNRNIISCIPKGTELLDIFIEGNTVYLNFNENFEFNPLGSEGTMVQIYQFVYTATQFEGIDNVIFLINGELNETIGSEGAIENMPFKRFQ
ncbi:GerMN domain-containing protein [Brachyspira murdochii]|uniref:Lipoprotein LpqB, GerMN domain protein n=1 Tax=Brachyspira murdochii (strain ATCC 51284 / DSM 12563 / 56-150) TaxID=526224 RepID=D5UAM6_BRAM5|nr:GerMN domain-containing protein [Brachyspira murdochii]ADG71749.1 Lipoprotein LpqB, GerMN domain protein [Brachyspira murdochii DSM 12563]